MHQLLAMNETEVAIGEAISHLTVENLARYYRNAGIWYKSDNISKKKKMRKRGRAVTHYLFSPSAQPSVNTYHFQTVETSSYTLMSCRGLFLYLPTASRTSRMTRHKSRRSKWSREQVEIQMRSIIFFGVQTV